MLTELLYGDYEKSKKTYSPANTPHKLLGFLQGATYKLSVFIWGTTSKKSDYLRGATNKISGYLWGVNYFIMIKILQLIYWVK